MTATGHLIVRTDVSFPLVECSLQIAHQFRMCRGQIMPFPRVLRHIEEIEIAPILEELPASRSDCPLLVRTSDPPKKLPLDQGRPATQGRQKIDPVEFIGGWDR